MTRPQSASMLISLAVNKQFDQLSLDHLGTLIELSSVYPELAVFQKEWRLVYEARRKELGIHVSTTSTNRITLDTTDQERISMMGRVKGTPPPGTFTPGPNRVNLDYPHYANNREIDPCPFCGSRAKMVVYNDSRNGYFVAVGECETSNCGCKMVHMDRDETQAEKLLVAAWKNRSHATTPVVPQFMLDHFNFFYGLISSSIGLIELGEKQKEQITKRLNIMREWLTGNMRPGEDEKISEQVQELFFRGRQG